MSEQPIISPRSTGREVPSTPEEVLQLMSNFVGPDGQTSTLSNDDTPPETISHGLPPGIGVLEAEEGLTSVCGEPWIPASNIGGESVLCRKCIEIGLTLGYQYT